MKHLLQSACIVSVFWAAILSATAQSEPTLARAKTFTSVHISLPDMHPVGPPKIVNIVNFIRLLEPRDSAITEDVLYQTVVCQIALMRKNRLPGTFLLQYDALIDPRYQKLLKSLSRDSFEIGAWWELPQPLIEKAGMKWRGRYPWDWRANVGFVTGYTPAEREKLIDIYMHDFKHIFGYYPKSVGSWFIDAHSLQYLYKKYHIVASCNCKDQYGTDGYTLWGGYWNQAYYPSTMNSYMPAQHAKNQVPVPIFRMLGSDPIRQYDNGLGSSRQGVVTLEPVYPKAGGDSTWINWFLGAFASDPSVGFNYTQAGQENSFTWDAMAHGLEMQMPLIAALRDQHKLVVETLAASGRWFKAKYAVTPATSFSVAKDLDGSDKKTVWYDSRFYRINLLWENNTLRIRDIHLFDEKFPSSYETQVATTNDCQFFTLPFTDGYLWSRAGQLAGLKFKIKKEGKVIDLEGGQPQFVRRDSTTLKVSWPLTNISGKLELYLKEDKVEIHLDSPESPDWDLELEIAAGVALPFQSIEPGAVRCNFEGQPYTVRALKGAFATGPQSGLVISPTLNTITLFLNAGQ